jgi:hypothetical protein
LYDWDNLAAMFKIPGDALECAGILANDSPSVIRFFMPAQELVARRGLQKTTIEILPLPPSVDVDWGREEEEWLRQIYARAITNCTDTK